MENRTLGYVYFRVSMGVSLVSCDLDGRGTVEMTGVGVNCLIVRIQHARCRQEVPFLRFVFWVKVSHFVCPLLLGLLGYFR